MMSAKYRLLALAVAAAVGILAAPASAAAAPEEPVTEAATEVTSTSATLHGTLNPHAGASSSYYFTYGHEGSCEGERTEPSAETTGEAILVSAPIAGLTPNRTYTYCLVAVNAGEEETEGAPMSFMTPPVLPQVEEETASPTGQTSATVSALVYPGFQLTFCLGFEYVDEASFNASEYSSATRASCEPELLAPFESERTVAALSGLTANTTYHYRVTVENGSGKAIGEDQTFLTLPPFPAVTTGSASFITADSATIAGTVDPGSEGLNSDTTYVFQYGTSAGYGQEVPLTPGTVGQGEIPVEEAASLTGLEPGTMYHYRVAATNSHSGTPQVSYGEDATFTTLTASPSLSGAAASSISERGATITATLSPAGFPTRYEVLVGPVGGPLESQASGNTASQASVALSFRIEGLSPGTVYSYEVVAANQSAAAQPGTGTFTTATRLTLGNAPLQPATPPLLAVPAIAFPGPAVPKPSETTARKLTKALEACRKKQNRGRRAACERQAHKRYKDKKSTKRSVSKH
jgi:hypothetical protein